MKKNKFSYYFLNALKLLVPKFIFRLYTKLFFNLNSKIPEDVLSRLNYYNKLNGEFKLPEFDDPQLYSDKVTPDLTDVRRFKKTKGTTYFFDLLEVVRCFPSHFKFSYLNGDVTHVPEHPTFVKSRPVSNNVNAVMLKLNKVRHFHFINDPVTYADKKNQIVWRGANFVLHRMNVLTRYYNHPLCDIGQTKPINGDPWEKGFMSIRDQLNYKFILCIEGNDVATNLKWAMSSNSVCVMSKPKYETWFMEGLLQPGVHYVECKDDYSDLPDKIEYYLNHQEAALEIVKNANKWTQQFNDKKKERLISLLVAQKYFNLSGQA